MTYTHCRAQVLFNLICIEIEIKSFLCNNECSILKKHSMQQCLIRCCIKSNSISYLFSFNELIEHVLRKTEFV
jgi:hypothetical protein